jgi:hypothetical protein
MMREVFEYIFAVLVALSVGTATFVCMRRCDSSTRFERDAAQAQIDLDHYTRYRDDESLRRYHAAQRRMLGESNKPVDMKWRTTQPATQSE